MKRESLSLVIMAAGKGRRFGGLKQLEGFGPQGQTLLDYALYDGLRAGIPRAVLVIDAAHEQEFMTRVVHPWRHRLAVHLVHQKLDDLPVLPLGGPGPAARSKPWGTGQALWAVRHVVHAPFLLCNADDFYGRQTYLAMADFLAGNPDPGTFALQGYNLLDTLPEEGGFSRGFCQVGPDGRLQKITEHLDVKRADHPAAGQIVSMNFWGLTPLVFSLVEEQFLAFLQENGHLPDGEFYLPAAIQAGLTQGRCAVKVLPPAGAWFGLTNPADRHLVSQRLAGLHQDGVYPEDLKA